MDLAGLVLGYESRRALRADRHAPTSDVGGAQPALRDTPRRRSVPRRRSARRRRIDATRSCARDAARRARRSRSDARRSGIGRARRSRGDDRRDRRTAERRSSTTSIAYAPLGAAHTARRSLGSMAARAVLEQHARHGDRRDAARRARDQFPAGIATLSLRRVGSTRSCARRHRCSTITSPIRAAARGAAGMW